MEEKREQKKSELRREELLFQQRKMDVEREPRREEVSIRREELTLQTKQKEAAAKDRQLLLEFFMKQTKQ